MDHDKLLLMIELSALALLIAGWIRLSYVHHRAEKPKPRREPLADRAFDMRRDGQRLIAE